MFGGFNINKLKPNVKMSVNRMQIIKNKKLNAIKAQKREVATLLAEGKEEKSRIRVSVDDFSCDTLQVEGIIREDFTIEAYEILELLCLTVAERAVR